MTRQEAIRILDPETTAEALAGIEYYAGFRGKEAVKKAVDDACILAVAASGSRSSGGGFRLRSGCRNLEKE